MEASTPPDAPPVAGSTRIRWTQNRLELLTWFRRNAPSLGELYEGSLPTYLFHNTFFRSVETIEYSLA